MNKCHICGKMIPKNEKTCGDCLKFLESVEFKAEKVDSIVIWEVDEIRGVRKFVISEEKFRENNGKNILVNKKVLVIIREDLDKIYVWSGLKSTSRQRKTALMRARDPKVDRYMSKIVSVYEEPKEFLENFGIKSEEVFERLIPMSIEDIRTDNDEEGGDFSLPYINKPPSPPDDLGLTGQLQAKEPITNQVLVYDAYCKHCGSELPTGQTVCHVCGKKI